MVAVEPGSAGIWQCESCHRAYEIQISFRPISLQPLDESRGEAVEGERAIAGFADEVEAEDAERCEELQRRLVDNQRESERLNQLVEQLRHEADRLRKEMEGG